MLALDGGGTRGIITSKILQTIEEKTGKQVYELFDLIAGTSTGGILAIALSRAKFTAEETTHLYRTLAKRVFGYRFGNLTRGRIKELRALGYYDATRLQNLLKEQLGKDGSYIRQDDVSPKVFVVASACSDNNMEPYIFRSYNDPNSTDQYYGSSKKDVNIVEALMATSAAPTYFDPVTINDCKFVDGGIVANNPADIALMEARLLWPQRKIVLISIGTGRPKEKEKEKEEEAGGGRHSSSRSSSSTLPRISSVSASVQPLYDIITVATDGEKIHKKLASWNKLLGSPVEYRRLNVPLTKVFDLAAYKEADIEAMITAAEKFCETEKGQIDDVVGLFK